MSEWLIQGAFHNYVLDGYLRVAELTLWRRSFIEIGMRNVSVTQAKMGKNNLHLVGLSQRKQFQGIVLSRIVLKLFVLQVLKLIVHQVGKGAQHDVEFEMIALFT